jgi:UV excision repair protein RAD23
MGNPDLAYEFLLTGIPEQAQRNVTAPTPTVAAPASGAGLNELRSHPQFNMLKQLIQSNPSSLPQVLSLIGQQSPALLEAIHRNEAEFLTMMNEPITTAPPAAVAVPAMAPQANLLPGQGGMPPGGMPNPSQMIQLLASMPPPQRAQFAQSLGMSPDQLAMFMQMVASMPPDQLQELLASSGVGGGGHPAGGPPPGSITLTHDEMESVNRLMALGFSQAQAAQAFIACDRNETLAANFLFENGWGDDGDEGEYEGGHDDDMYS